MVYKVKVNVELAREDGEIKGKREVAINGLQEGLSVEIIMKLTGLTENEINELK